MIFRRYCRIPKVHLYKQVPGFCVIAPEKISDLAMSPLVAASDGDRRNPARGRPGLAGKGRVSGVGSPRVPFEAVRRSEDAPAMENSGAVDLRPPQPLFRCTDRECWASCGSGAFREGQGRCVRARKGGGGATRSGASSGRRRRCQARGRTGHGRRRSHAALVFAGG
jgi:hypothetical protein